MNIQRFSAVYSHKSFIMYHFKIPTFCYKNNFKWHALKFLRENSNKKNEHGCTKSQIIHCKKSGLIVVVCVRIFISRVCVQNLAFCVRRELCLGFGGMDGK